MAIKSIMLVGVLVCAMLMGASKVRGQFIPGLIPLPGIPLIQGNVTCALNASLPGTTAPPFPNATVQLICGTTVLASAITNSNGLFSIVLNPVTFVLTTLTSILSSCRLVVATPLSACNATLPSTVGLLTSLLQFVGTAVHGLLNFALFIPIAFEARV